MDTPNKLAVIVPCYNETAVLNVTNERLCALLDDMVDMGIVDPESLILYVNDGSRDATWEMICELHAANKRVRGICLANNVGHQNALVAGLTVALDMCDMAVTIDADLQDDENAVKEMVMKCDEGYDIIYGVRRRREHDTAFKRTTAQVFYRLMHAMGTKTIYNHADFRLMTKRAIRSLLSYKERNLFLRGLVPTIGYKSAMVYYDRTERLAGESKYPLSKMLNLAVDGITSFSIKPIRLITVLGMVFVGISLGVLCWIAYCNLIGQVVRGWSSLMLSIWFCTGCVLIALGIVGEYVGKTYMETKERPRFIIQDEI